jgi:hypothetical protein
MVKIIKLQNNSEIIGEIISEAGDTIVVDNPFTINYIFTPKSQRPVIGLLRYLPFAEQRIITFQKNHILHVVDARPAMSGYYVAVVKSHISEIDDGMDRELTEITEMENADSELHNATDVLSAMLEKLNPNNNVH